MAARLLLHEKVLTGHGDLTETVVWSVPRTTAYPWECATAWRSCRGARGGRRCSTTTTTPRVSSAPGGREEPYEYVDIRRLRLDFERDVARWRETRREL